MQASLASSYRPLYARRFVRKTLRMVTLLEVSYVVDVPEDHDIEKHQQDLYERHTVRD